MENLHKPIQQISKGAEGRNEKEFGPANSTLKQVQNTQPQEGTESWHPRA